MTMPAVKPGDMGVEVVFPSVRGGIGLDEAGETLACEARRDKSCRLRN
jgi:hypothetical protein